MSQLHTDVEPDDAGGQAPAKSVGWPRPRVIVGVIVSCVVLGAAFGGFLRQQGITLKAARSSAPALAVAGEPGAGDLSAGAARSAGQPGVEVIDDLAELPPGPVDKLELAYFHRTHRCSGCIKAEELTRKTLDAYYTDRLGSGDMVFLVEDVEQPADPMLVRKYDAFGSMLYLGVVKRGVTYVYAVNDIWFELGSEENFKAMLRGKIDTALGDS